MGNRMSPSDHHQLMRVAWAGTEYGMTPRLKDRGSCGCLGWIPEGSLHPSLSPGSASLQAGQERAEH